MIVIFFRTFCYFFAAVLKAMGGIKKNNKKLYFSGVSLNRLSFRLPNNSRNDFFALFRLYKRIIYTSLSNTVSPIDHIATGPIAIFDTSNKAKALRISYVQKITQEKIGTIVSKDRLITFINIQQLLLVFTFLLTALFPLFLLSVFNKNKSKYPLLAIEFIECFNLLILLKKSRINKVHYFCIYERDANICAYILMKQNIYINKIPSEVPLVFWNKIIVADSLSLCFKYQEEEVVAYKETMFIDKINYWVPETAFVAPEKYLDPNIYCQTGYIGFYSSGNWLRAYKGDVNLGTNEKDNEELLLTWLIEYVNSNPQLKLMIYMHPLEKKEEFIALSQRYYSDKINETTVILADSSKQSANSFEEVELGIALYSTIMFERIFFGFKTLLMPLGYDFFPIENSNFCSICAKTKDDLFRKINENLGLTSSEYFIKNGLINYDIKSYLNYFNKLT